MLTLQKVVEIGNRYPISKDPDFWQEAHLIRLLTRTTRGAERAWKRACKKYGYSKHKVQPIREERLRLLNAFNRRSFFAKSIYRKARVWEKLDGLLLPEEKAVLKKWTHGGGRMTPQVCDVIDTVIAMTIPL